MLNPAHAAYGLVGVYSTSVSHLMADSLQVGLPSAVFPVITVLPMPSVFQTVCRHRPGNPVAPGHGRRTLPLLTILLALPLPLVPARSAWV